MPNDRHANRPNIRHAYRRALADWCTQQRLAAQPAQQAWAATEPRLADWHRWLDRALLALGVALLCSGVIVFFAFNWQALHKFTRFGVLALLISALAAFAWRRPDGDAAGRAALVGAQMVTGALLAVIGQVYQTGADPWQLFAWWALLAVPWALAAHAPLHWALAVVLANVALLRFFSVEVGTGLPFSLLFDAVGGRLGGLCLLAAALVQLALWLVLSAAAPRFGVRGRGGARLLAALSCAYAIWLGLAALFGSHVDGGMLVVSVVALLAVGAWFRYRTFDLLVLSLTALSLIALAVAALGRGLAEAGAQFGGFLLLGLMTLGLSGAAAAWLMRLYRNDTDAMHTGAPTSPQRPDAEPQTPASSPAQALWRKLAADRAVQGEAPTDTEAPWSVRLLTGMAGWLGAVFFQLFLLGTVFVAARENSVAILSCGLALIALAALLYRGRAGHTGFEQFALASSLTGQGLAFYAAADLLGRARAVETAAFWCGLAACEMLLYAAIGNRLHRLLSALAAMVSVAIALTIAIAMGPAKPWQAVGWALAWLAPIALLKATLFAGVEGRLAALGRHHWLGPAADALLFCGLLGALIVTGIGHPLGLFAEPALQGVPHWLAGALLAVMLVGFGIVEAARLGLSFRRRAALATVLAVCAAPMVGAPAVVAGVLAAGLALRRASLAWLGLGLTAIGLGFIWYYSALHWTLAIKSGTLVLAGTAVLAARAWLSRPRSALGVADIAEEGGR
ncbi:DUF4401 domain-containing protein [Cupriavidus gilardii]|uniref:DUF4401 domain-containing protein n=1 Tax=Cupriavidus gilardii TaxID=82541 RepID=UPI00349FE443